MPAVGALAIFIYKSMGLSRSPGAYRGGDSPGCGVSLALGTSCGKSSNSLFFSCSIKHMGYVCSYILTYANICSGGRKTNK